MTISATNTEIRAPLAVMYHSIHENGIFQAIDQVPFTGKILDGQYCRHDLSTKTFKAGMHA